MPHPRLRIVLAAFVAVALAVGAYFVFRPTDEARIRAQLDRLAEVVRISDTDAQENPIARLARVDGGLKELFEPDVRLSIPEVTSVHSGRRELAELLVGAPRYVRSFEVSFTSVTVKLDEARTTALVGATAKVKLHEREGSPSQDARAVDLRFVQKDGRWVIRTLTVWSKEDARPE
jgi:hypothetical protein